MTQVLSGTVIVDGQRVRYDDYGSGDRVVVLLHALLTSRALQAPLAWQLQARGFRVVCLDLLADPAAGAEREIWRYSVDKLAEQVLAALDELGINRAVFGGTSIGSNVSLQCAVTAPERVVGVICEAPFLEDSQQAMSLLWSSLYGLFTLGAPVLRAVGLGARIIPSRPGSLIGLARDILTRDPGAAAAFMQGLFYGRVGPAREDRLRITAPALVIGVHPIDRLHVLSDAQRLVAELPEAELLRTASLADLRLRPRRLAERVAVFAGDCWVRAGDPAGSQAPA